MKSDRLLIASVVFLAVGLGLIVGYCHGTAGLSVAFPVSGASLHLCINTPGAPALIGFAITVIGLLLFLWAVVEAVTTQVQSMRGTAA